MMKFETEKVTFEEYEEKRATTLEFFKELDVKIEELHKESDKIYKELQENKTDKLFIDYILASNSVSKLQDTKINMLKILEAMKNNIEFID